MRKFYNNASYTTIECVVFLIIYFQSLILWQFYNKLQLKVIQIICVSPLMTAHSFHKIRFHGGPSQGRDLSSLRAATIVLGCAKGEKHQGGWYFFPHVIE